MLSLKKSLNVFACVLTALLVGGIIGFYGTNQFYKTNLQNEKYVTNLYETFQKANANAPKASAAAAVRAVGIDYGQAQEFRTILGRLTELNRATVASEVSGRLLSISVEEGTPVKAGMEIARIDTVWNELSIKETTAQIAALKAKRDYETGELKRSKTLISSQAISQSDFESTESTIQELTAQIEAQEALLEEHRERVARSIITAPFDGVVVERFVDVGSYVTPGTAIAEVISTGDIDAKIYIPESVIQRIQTGERVEISVDALQQSFVGQVALIISSAETASRTFPIRVRMQDQDGLLKAGMSVTATIPTSEPFDAFLLPSDAVLRRPDACTVWLAMTEDEAGNKVEGFVAEPVIVDILAEMPTGLAVAPTSARGRKIFQKGVPAIIEGAERLSPGMAIRLIESPYKLEPIPGHYESGQQRKDFSEEQKKQLQEAESEAPTEGETSQETKPEETPAANPSTGETGGESPSTSGANSSGETPAGDPAGNSVETLVEEEPSVETLAAESPADPPAETLVKTPVETLAETPAKTPAGRAVGSSSTEATSSQKEY